MLYYITIGILLLWSSIQDIKSKRIQNGGLVAGVVIVLALFFLDGVKQGLFAEFLLSEGGVPWKNVWGLVPGVGVLLLSLLIPGSVGKGDGYLLCISGLALGLVCNFSLLCYGLFLAGGTAAVLLAVHKVKRDTKLPFVPFLLGGFILMVLQKYL